MCLKLTPESNERDVLVAIILKIVENKVMRDLNSVFANFYCFKNVLVEMYQLLAHVFTAVVVSSDKHCKL